MMNTNSIVRVAIFVDYQDFIKGYRNVHSVERIELEFWQRFNSRILDILKEKEFVDDSVEIAKHKGTWIILGREEYPDNKEQGFLSYMKNVDQISGKLISFPEKMEVKVELVSQMLTGVFNDFFDLIVLVADDGSYTPAVQRAQDFFGKNVIHFGFDKKTKLRYRSYGHVSLEDRNESFDKKIPNTL